MTFLVLWTGISSSSLSLPLSSSLLLPCSPLYVQVHVYSIIHRYMCMCMCTCTCTLILLTYGILNCGADVREVALETVISFDSDVAVAESDGGGLVGGLPNSITNLSLGCIQYVRTFMYKSTMKIEHTLSILMHVKFITYLFIIILFGCRCLFSSRSFLGGFSCLLWCWTIVGVVLPLPLLCWSTVL